MKSQCNTCIGKHPRTLRVLCYRLYALALAREFILNLARGNLCEELVLEGIVRAVLLCKYYDCTMILLRITKSFSRSLQ